MAAPTGMIKVTESEFHQAMDHYSKAISGVITVSSGPDNSVYVDDYLKQAIGYIEHDTAEHYVLPALLPPKQQKTTSSDKVVVERVDVDWD